MHNRVKQFRNHLGALGCGCQSGITLSGLGDCSGPNVPVYLFWLNTTTNQPGPNGPYTFAQVPFSFLGQNAVSIPNAPPDAVQLDAANVGAKNVGANQVRWLSQSIFPNQTSVSDDGGGMSINSANAAGTSQNFVFDAPDNYLVTQAGQLANQSNCGMIRVGWIVQSIANVNAFIRQNLQSQPTAPTQGTTAQLVSASTAAPQATMQTASNVVPSGYAEGPSFVAGNSAVTTDPAINAAPSSEFPTTLLIALGVAALLLLS